MSKDTKPTARVLALLEILQSQRQASGPELATRLGVEPRTVRRYVGHLLALGVPVETLRGRDGGYALGAGHKLPPLMFSPEEALALAMGLRAARELGHGRIRCARGRARLDDPWPSGRRVRRRS